MPFPESNESNESNKSQRRQGDILCLVNRAIKQTNSLGGKGQNFAVATRGYYGDGDRVELLQILGGPTGEQIQAMEDAQGFVYTTVWTSKPTRTCTTCLDMTTGEMTEMVGVSGVIDPIAEAEYERVAVGMLGGRPRALALCGTFPPGLRAATVARIIAARAPGTMVFVDAVQDIQPVLATGCIDILKVNSGEVLSILSSLDTQYAGLKSPAEMDLAAAANSLGKRFSIGVMAVTDGPYTAYLADTKRSRCFAFCIPDLLDQRESLVRGSPLAEGCGEMMLNPLGAGDTCSAIMLNLLLEGSDVVEAFAQGLAAASASCLVPMPNCIFDRQVMERIRDQITITEL
ncbi:hypothetical protein GGF46_001630 [Coemansia sp. RSA 552]|nr:hypothetical protein GGF46_001630 [Coemansia sp. RSA 552]